MAPYVPAPIVTPLCWAAAVVSAAVIVTAYGLALHRARKDHRWRPAAWTLLVVIVAVLLAQAARLGMAGQPDAALVQALIAVLAVVDYRRSARSVAVRA